MAHRRPGRRRPRKKISGPPAPPSAKAPAPAPKPAAKPAARQAPKGLAQASARRAQEGAETDPLVGKSVGKCRLEARIGRGRTAVVYRADHASLGATVAVKILLPASAEKPQLVESFMTEARAIARIDNENVLKIYDVAEQGGLHYSVMELLEGEEVLDIISREGRLEVMDALRITRQAANGLSAAHAQQTLHRDVKPQNLVLLEDGTVKVVDFGLAGAVEGDTRRVGTPHFMAPETCESGEATVRSDIYSLGITLYHMLVGQPPYAGKDIPGIMAAHVKGVPLEPEKARPGLAKEVADLVRWMTKRDPDARPTASEVIEALDRFGGEALQEKIQLRRRRSRMRAHIAASRNKSMAPMIALVLVAVAALAFVVLSSKKDEDGGDAPEPGPAPHATRPTPPPAVVPTRPPPAVSRPPGSTSVETPPGPAPTPDPNEDEAEQRRQVAGDAALQEAEAFARKTWRTVDDTAKVLAKYRAVTENFAGTKGATEAQRRIRLITTGKMHPHPDREYSDLEEIVRARKAWQAAKPKIDPLLAEFRYYRARQLVPKPVQGGEESLEKDIAFYRAFLDHLVRYKGALGKEVPKLPEEERRLETREGAGVVQKVTDHQIFLKDGIKKFDVKWTDVEPEAIASLGRKALQEGDARTQLYALAFAFAHRLWEAFWEAELDLSMLEGSAESEYMLGEYKARIEARKGG